MYKFKRVILITGAAGGIGSIIVKNLAQNNNYVIATDSNKRGLDALTSISSSCQTKLCDLTDTNDILSLIKLCQEHKVDTIIHSAGYGGPFLQLDSFSLNDWEKVFDINVKSLFLITKGILPIMKNEGFGRIIAISSIQSLFGSSGSAAYVSSKHALNGLIKTIAVEFGQFGISANAVCPGYIKSPMGADDSKVDSYMQKVINRTPSRKIGTPEQISKLIKLLISDDMSYMNGSIITLDGGISSDIGIL